MAIETRTLVPTTIDGIELTAEATALEAATDIDTATVTIVGGTINAIVIVSDDVADPTTAIDNAISTTGADVDELSGYPIT